MTETLDRHDRRLALSATGELARLNAAGILESADVHVASRLAELVHETDTLVQVTLALVVRAAREGSTSLDPHHARELLLEEVSTPARMSPGTCTEGEAATRISPGTCAEGEAATRMSPGKCADGGVGTAKGAPVETTPAEGTGDDLPDDTAWLERVRESALARAGVIVVEHGLVHLDRYHREEVQVADDLRRRSQGQQPTVDEAVLEAGLDRVFPGASWAEQRAAVRTAAGRLTTVLAGGPGTGKTSTVAGLLTLLLEQAEVRGHRPRIALAAPTGKAAARLRESVLGSVVDWPASDRERLGADIEAVTIHRLLGWRPDSGNRFRRDRGNPLPHDIVVVDEASMLSLTLTARLLEALRPTTRLLLVGDPDQLASVEAGAVLADLVAGYGDDGPVVRLSTSHRFGAEIGELAEAVRTGDADRVIGLLASARPGGPVEHLAVDDVLAADEALRQRLLEHATSLRDLALRSRHADALRALGEHRLLCAHRDGPWGVGPWNDRVERWLAETSEYAGRQMLGRPLLVTTNDRGLGLYNGDTGVMSLRPEDGRVVGVFGEPDAPQVHAASTLGEVDTAHAMTIHKSQGSQARSITVLLPDADSRLLTRELLYTAITRAQESVTLVGSEEAVRAAVTRRTQRATGLRHRV